jgi:DNA-binding MarR family transcriptional regulator
MARRHGRVEPEVTIEIHQLRCIVPDVHGQELFRLSRRLIRLSIDALPPSPFSALPISVRMVLVDVVEHPGTSIGEIVERTGFPQSHVSASVARLRDEQMVVTAACPHDRRKTLVSCSPAHLERVRSAGDALEPVDDTVTAALVERFGPEGAARTAEAVAALELLASLLIPERPRTPSSSGDHQC